jgi:hypothetical protein
MPAKSKQQYKFMKAIEGGYIKQPGLSKEKAKEYTAENIGSKSPSHLPKFAKLKKRLKKV